VLVMNQDKCVGFLLVGESPKEMCEQLCALWTREEMPGLMESVVAKRDLCFGAEGYDVVGFSSECSYSQVQLHLVTQVFSMSWFHRHLVRFERLFFVFCMATLSLRVIVYLLVRGHTQDCSPKC